MISTGSIEVVSSISAIQLSKWDTLCSNHPFAKYRWQQLLEKTLINYKPHYIQIIGADQQLIAAAICHFQRDFHIGQLANNFIRGMATRALRTAPPLSCTIPVLNRSGLIFAPDVDKSVALPLLLKAISKIAFKHLTLFINYNNLNLAQGEALSGTRQFVKMALPPESYLPISWENFTEFEAALPKKKRHEIRRMRRRAREAGVTIERVLPTDADFSATERRIEALMRGLEGAHENEYNYCSNLHTVLQHTLPDTDYRILVARHEGDIIGCTTLFISDGEVLVKWGGLDYERTKPVHAYHYLLTETVQHAIEMQAKRLTLGVTTYILKKKMGALFDPRMALVDSRIALLNKAATKIMQRKQAAPQSS